MGEVMERTKTGRRLRVPLPEELMAILQWHVDNLPAELRRSELLFPSEMGGFRAGSCLKRPLEHIAKAAGIKKRLTARFMRRTFQDLGRAVRVHDFVVRAISGHATAQMQEHYSSVNADEVRTGLAKVISIAGFVRAHQTGIPGASEAGGDRGGDRACDPSQSGREAA